VPVYSFGLRPIEIDGYGVKDARANFKGVSDFYFETLGIPVLQGRSFVQKDLLGPQGVAVVNQTFFDA